MGKHSKSFETLGLEKFSNCPLCGASICSLHHILSNCTVALRDERYTWRHNSVLFEIQKVIQNHINNQNASPVNERLPHISSSFVPAGKAPTKTKSKMYSGLIAGSNDWKLLVDHTTSNATMRFAEEDYKFFVMSGSGLIRLFLS